MCLRPVAKSLLIAAIIGVTNWWLGSQKPLWLRRRGWAASRCFTFTVMAAGQCNRARLAAKHSAAKTSSSPLSPPCFRMSSSSFKEPSSRCVVLRGPLCKTERPGDATSLTKWKELQRFWWRQAAEVLLLCDYKLSKAIERLCLFTLTHSETLSWVCKGFFYNSFFVCVVFILTGFSLISRLTNSSEQLNTLPSL